MTNPKVLVVATSRKTRGGITSVIKAHETGEQWKKYHCKWIQTHRDGPSWRKMLYFVLGSLQYLLLAPFYDIIHMHVSCLGSLTRKCLYMRYAKFLHKKTIVHFHPPSPDVLLDLKEQSKYKYLFKNADKVIVLSKMWQNLIENVIYGDGAFLSERKNNISVLYNPCPKVDRNDLVPFYKREKYILLAGTLIARKGYKCLIRAFSHIARLHPEWKVMLAGVDEENEVDDLIRKLNIESQVSVLGWCNKDTMNTLYKNASVYCLASSGEGFPMVVLEAWAYGVPVVCTPVGGLPDIVDENVNALTFDFDNDIMLSERLEKLINDEKLRERLSCAGLELAKNIFDIQEINQQLGKIYETL